jgi:hypothetical protein
MISISGNHQNIDFSSANRLLIEFEHGARWCQSGRGRVEVLCCELRANKTAHGEWERKLSRSQQSVRRLSYCFSGKRQPRLRAARDLIKSTHASNVCSQKYYFVDESGKGFTAPGERTFRSEFSCSNFVLIKIRSSSRRMGAHERVLGGR